MPKGKRRFEERTARIILTYFHPWTLIKTRACKHVPHISTLGGDPEKKKVVSRNAWMQGQTLTEEMKRVLTHFMSVTSVRPQERDVEADNSIGEESDVECFVHAEDLEHVLQTKTSGQEGFTEEDKGNAAFKYAKKCKRYVTKAVGVTHEKFGQNRSLFKLSIQFL